MSRRDYRTAGKAKHTQWENRRTSQGICVKCDQPLCKRSGRFCEKHRLWNNERSKAYYRANKKTCNDRSRLSGHRARVRAMVLLGGLVCTWCGEDDYRVLTIDHINGRTTPKKKTRSGLDSKEIYDIESGRASRKNLRVLCANCQARNEHVRGNRQIRPQLASEILAAGGKLLPLPSAS